jgi:hypothetical protein
MKVHEFTLILTANPNEDILAVLSYAASILASEEIKAVA